MVFDKIKNLGKETKEKAKGKGKDAYEKLKEKYRNIRKKKEEEPDKKGEEKPEKKDLLGGMVDTGTPLKRMAKEEGYKGPGRTETVKKKSFFGGIKDKFNKLSEERSKKKRAELNVKKMRKCHNCGTVYEGTALEPCPNPKCGFDVEQQKKAAKLKGRKIKGEGTKPSVSIVGSWGSIIFGGIITAVGVIFTLPMTFYIPFIVLIALGIISFFLPEELKKGFFYVIILGFLGSFAFLIWTGGFDVVFAHPAVRPYMDQMEGAYYEISDNIVTAYETSKCYTKINPELVDACLGELEESEEEKVRKIGKNENLKLTYGQMVGGKTFKNEKPYVDRRYNYYFMLKNENSEEYEIEVTDITVFAIGDVAGEDGNEPQEEPGIVRRQIPYTIKPQEELPVRVEWSNVDPKNELPECTNSIEFNISITSIQKSGGGSGKYGLVPQEEGYISFLHYFDPEIETNPGPLDMYVFIDPYAVNYDWYQNKGFVVIIKIKNRAEGTAFLDNITLVQTFDTPWEYFYFDSPCYDEEGNEFPLDTESEYEEGECSGDEYPANCYTLKFEPPDYEDRLILTKDETKEIICGAKFHDEISNLVGTYTDLISVFTPSYEFLQEFKETKIAECGLTGVASGAKCTQHSDCCWDNGGSCGDPDSQVDAYCWVDTGECACGLGGGELCPKMV